MLIEHPFGDLWPTLASWIERGPGARVGLRPVAARSRLTGETLPLSVIPLRYRNDAESHAAIERGDFTTPGQTTSLRVATEPPTTIRLISRYCVRGRTHHDES